MGRWIARKGETEGQKLSPQAPLCTLGKNGEDLEVPPYFCVSTNGEVDRP